MTNTAANRALRVSGLLQWHLIHHQQQHPPSYLDPQALLCFVPTFGVSLVLSSSHARACVCARVHKVLFVGFVGTITAVVRLYRVCICVFLSLSVKTRRVSPGA